MSLRSTFRKRLNKHRFGTPHAHPPESLGGPHRGTPETAASRPSESERRAAGQKVVDASYARAGRTAPQVAPQGTRAKRRAGAQAQAEQMPRKQSKDILMGTGQTPRAGKPKQGVWQAHTHKPGDPYAAQHGPDSHTHRTPTGRVNTVMGQPYRRQSKDIVGKMQGAFRKRWTGKAVSQSVVSPHPAPSRSGGVPEKHQLRIARQNARMHPAMRGVMGAGDTHEHKGTAHSHPDAWDANDAVSHTHKAIRKHYGADADRRTKPLTHPHFGNRGTPGGTQHTHPPEFPAEIKPAVQKHRDVEGSTEHHKPGYTPRSTKHERVPSYVYGGGPGGGPPGSPKHETKREWWERTKPAVQKAVRLAMKAVQGGGDPVPKKRPYAGVSTQALGNRPATRASVNEYNQRVGREPLRGAR